MIEIGVTIVRMILPVIVSLIALMMLMRDRTRLNLMFLMWAIVSTIVLGLSTISITSQISNSVSIYAFWLIVNWAIIISGVILFAAYILKFTFPADPSEQNALYQKAWSLWEQGRPRLARLFLIRAARHAPNNFELHELLGVTYQETGNCTQAIREFEGLVNIDPERAIGYLRLGAQYYLCQDLLKARVTYENGLAKHPDDSHLLFGLGELLHELGEKQESVELLRRAYDLDPSREQVQLGLAEAYADVDRIPEALKLWESIILNSKDKESLEEANSSLVKYKASGESKD